MSTYEDRSGPNIRVPLLFSVRVVLVLVATVVLLVIQGWDETDATTDKVLWPFALVGLPAAGIIAFFGWRAVSETDPLDEPRDWVLPIATTLLLIAVAVAFTRGGSRWLGVLVGLSGPFAAAFVASLRGPAARVFVVVTGAMTSGFLLLASIVG